MNIPNKTRLNMVIGNPLGHSQSPLLHNTVYQSLNIDYVLLAQPHPQLKSLVQAIKTLAVDLTAVTLPYKEKIIAYLDQCSAEVKALRAANTIIQRNGKLYGYNTDVDGIQFALRETVLRSKRVLVIGAGGAARALGYVLKKNRSHIYWVNRTKSKALTLAKQFGGCVVNESDVNAMTFDIIINTTPIGLYPHVQNMPLPDYSFNANQVVFDMVYNPITTQLLKQAKKQRATTLSGLDMFIGQGLIQIELLTGKRIQTPTLITKLRRTLTLNQRAARP